MNFSSLNPNRCFPHPKGMRYRLLGHSGLRVSEICLGTMTFGTEWPLGGDHEQSKAVFDAYANAGGNFLDTANRYTEGTSEKWVGEYIVADRDHFVVATKYTLHDRPNDPNFAGNHRKNMMRSVEASLKRLNIDCIDLFWVHLWDSTTPVEEVMRGLEDLTRMGKIHYIGISDTPAWIVSRANMLAELRGWNRFAALQLEYSLIQRTPERDLFPMAKALDLAITPWAVLAGGALSGKYLRGEPGRVPENSIRRNERSARIAEVAASVAAEMSVTPVQVAVRWTMQRGQLVIPIVGARRAEQIEDSLGATKIELSPAHMQRLDEATAIEPGFPHDFLKSDAVKGATGNSLALIDSHRL
jgi:aryl-alcohol dehydrogenase-like predicted oxidoreductase